MDGIYIGCAGWSLSRESWLQFGTTGSHLQRYSRILNGVEINSSFYRFHKPSTYASWAQAVPAEFKFSVKLFRGITHEHRLEKCEDLLSRFFEGVTQLGPKCDVILSQLPPSLSFVPGVAHSFLELLRRHFAGPIALEARHRSWFERDAISALESFDVVPVEADPAVSLVPSKQRGSFAYLRLHGNPEMYVSNYPDPELAKIAARIRALKAAKSRVWCVFDNTMVGHAVKNAVSLKERLEETHVSAA